MMGPKVKKCGMTWVQDCFWKSSGPKSKKKQKNKHQDCFKSNVQKHLWWNGGVLVPIASWVTVTSVTASLMLHTGFWATNASFQMVSLSETTAYFSENTFCRDTTTWLCSKTVQLVCVQSRPVFYWKCTLWSTKYNQASLDVFLERMRKNSTVNNWATSVFSSPTLTESWKRWCNTVVNMLLSPFRNGLHCNLQFWICGYFAKNKTELTSLNNNSCFCAAFNQIKAEIDLQITAITVIY